MLNQSKTSNHPHKLLRRLVPLAVSPGTLVLMTLIGLGLRWLLVSPYPQGWDSVDFALALEHYDLESMQPHFPGYPVYIILGRLAAVFMPEAVPMLVLARISALSVLILIPAAWFWYRSQLPVFWTGLAALWLLVSPGVALTGELPMSDALALSLLMAVWALDAHRRHVGAALVMGLVLGVRLSYWPFVISLLLPSAWTALRCHDLKSFLQAIRRALPQIWSLALGISVWLFWQWSQEGMARWWQLAWQFTFGHFSDWGGAVGSWATEDLGFINRLQFVLADNLYRWGMGGWLPASMPAAYGALIAMVIIAGLMLYRRIGRICPYISNSSARTDKAGKGKMAAAEAASKTNLPTVAVRLSMLAVPYLIWVLFGQNPMQPRHILPLVPISIAFLLHLLTAGSLNHPRRSFFNKLAGLAVILWLASAAMQTGPLLLAQQQVPPVEVQLADWLKKHIPAEETLVLTWEEERVLLHQAPAYRAVSVRTWAQLRRAVLATPQPPVHIFFTSKVLNGLPDSIIKEQLRPHLTRAAQFQPPFQLGLYTETIILWQGKDSLPNWIKTSLKSVD